MVDASLSISPVELLCLSVQGDRKISMIERHTTIHSDGISCERQSSIGALHVRVAVDLRQIKISTKMRETYWAVPFMNMSLLETFQEVDVGRKVTVKLVSSTVWMATCWL